MNVRSTQGLLACLLWLVAARPVGAEVLVSAAASLTDVLTTIAARFEAATGERVLLNFGASNTLARQIASGARVDVFLSADEAQMDRTAADVLPGTRFDLLANQLAIAVPRGAAVLGSPRDLLAVSIRRVAVGDPDAVPAGVYARQYFQKLGLWAALQPKMIPTGSVRLALAAVENGAADAAVVYVTDVASARGARIGFVVGAAEGPRIRYPAAVMRSAPNVEGGRRFLTFLQGADARAAFIAAGFGIITNSGQAQP